jgi:Raf kinase inhibitor-like YbhB/YbcL family protein
MISTWIRRSAGPAAALLLAACGATTSADRGDEEADALAAKDIPAGADGFAVSSVNFEDGAPLPARFTCDATDISPALTIDGVPDGTAELAIVVDDPDAADGTYVHWIVGGLAPTTGALAEDLVPEDAVQARNSDGGSSYRGPCPPEGDPAHTYRFTVYALDAEVADDIENADASDALELITEHATAKAVLTATYQRAG